MNAEVALAQLRRRLHDRLQVAADRPRVHVQLTASTFNEIKVIWRKSGRQEIQQAIRLDLEEAAAIDYRSKLQQDKRPNAEHEFYLLGKQLRYQVNLRASGPDAGVVLDIVGVTQLPASLLENLRDRFLLTQAEFSFDVPLSPLEARYALDALRSQVAEHAQRRTIREWERQEKELFYRWRSILRAKRWIEQERAKPLAYTLVQRKGQKTVIFTLKHAPEDDLRGQNRRVGTDHGPLRGVVDEVNGTQLTLHIEEGNPHNLPAEGVIEFDTDISLAAIRRQEQALDEVMYMRGVRSDLARLLVHPGYARTPQPVGEPALLQPHIDDAKKNALCIALGSPDFTLVQGPPGTGKTTWIAETVCQFLYLYPGKKVLLSAQTHIAVDNALKKIAELRQNLRLIRAGKTAKIDEAVVQYQIEPQMQAWAEQVRERSRRSLLQLARQRGVGDDHITLWDNLASLWQAESRLAGMKQRSENIHTDEEEEGCPAVEAGVAQSPEPTDALRKQIQVLRTDIADELEADGLRIADLQTISRSVEARIGLASDDAYQLRKLQSIQAEWFQRFGHGDGFDKALISVSDVVAGTCVGIAAAGRLEDAEFDLVVIDEASKATPTESLVAMARGKQWILVGDQKQLPPFTEDELRDETTLARFDLTPELLEETLFDRLLLAVPADCRPRLTMQHRMVKAIGDLISHCFYESELASRRTESRKNSLARLLPQPVTWYSTSKLPSRREQARPNRDTGKPSCLNPEEAKRILSWLQELEDLAREEGEDISVGVISGYIPQKNYLTRIIDPKHRGRWRKLSIEVNTVDAVQGCEFDAAVYSVTRSNVSKALGFLTTKRLNVALSRGQDALVIFGDAEHCRSSNATENPFSVVLTYIGDHPDTCSIQVL